MPEVIDNIKVGEIIKQLLKEHNMTQDDLAKSLMISKSAVSQNLNGKSTFDIQNLINIAKIFNVSLDYLLDQTSNEDEDIISEYERLTKKGLEALKKIPLESLNVSKPDLYNKVLAQYIIAYRKKEMLTYLLELDVPLVFEQHHLAKKVYLEIITYILQENLPKALEYILSYSSLHHSFLIDDEEAESKIWQELNNNKHERLVSSMLLAAIGIPKKFLNIFSYTQQQKILAKKEWIRVIAKYKLQHILRIFQKNTPYLEEFPTIVSSFITLDYPDGLLQYAKDLDKESHHFVSKQTDAVLQDIISLQNLDLLSILLEKEIYHNMNHVISYAIKGNFFAGFLYILQKHISEISLRKCAAVCTKEKNVLFIKEIIHLLTQDDKDMCLGISDPDDITMHIFLYVHGARFTTLYINHKTMQKMNSLMEYYTEKGTKEPWNF